MSWVEIFAAFGVCHLVGDYLLQTDWQARHKHGGLRRNAGASRRALIAHVSVYTLALLPAVLFAASGWQVLWALGLIFLPHLIQDDGRLIAMYMAKVKGVRSPGGSLAAVVDQSFHALALFGLALLLGS